MIQKFEFKELDMKGAYETTPFYATDERGGFVKDYNIDTFNANGIDHELKEVFCTIYNKAIPKREMQLDYNWQLYRRFNISMASASCTIRKNYSSSRKECSRFFSMCIQYCL